MTSRRFEGFSAFPALLYRELNSANLDEFGDEILLIDSDQGRFRIGHEVDEAVGTFLNVSQIWPVVDRGLRMCWKLMLESKQPWRTFG